MIEIGDFVPTFELQDQRGRQCFSGADLFSGDPRAYLFCPAGAGELTDKVARAFVDAADALRRAGGVGEIDRCFAKPHRGKRVFNIDPPTSPKRHLAEGKAPTAERTVDPAGTPRRA